MRELFEKLYQIEKTVNQKPTKLLIKEQFQQYLNIIPKKQVIMTYFFFNICLF